MSITKSERSVKEAFEAAHLWFSNAGRGWPLPRRGGLPTAAATN